MRYYFRVLFHLLKTEVWQVPGRMIAAVFLAGLLLFPMFSSHPYVFRILTLAAIFSIFAASWDVLSGFTGQINLGHALFFGVAAYTGAKLNLLFNLPPWITIPMGGFAAVLVGLVAGIPALRLRGFYLALVTLALPVILSGIIFMFPDFTGGELGLYGIDGFTRSRIADYYVIVFIMILSVYAMYKFTDAESKYLRTGMLLHAIREDEITARASGINTIKYKLIAFAVSAFFAGISGGIYTHYMKIVGPSTLELFFSFQAILWTIFGGIATIYGAVAGVFILYPLIELMVNLPLGQELRLIVFALILILSMLFMPQGLTTWVLNRIETTCPRCKIINAVTRHRCRACRASLLSSAQQAKTETRATPK